ncbi:GD14440 [Drosophila simulans]|uniref:GD14440 n=1 Tax=Drosophila simulans TaxID=7240 RepID=B4QJ09_DROSI|nr:GD14440 [Drosophila simulans]
MATNKAQNKLQQNTAKTRKAARNKSAGQNATHVHEKIQRTELEKLTKTVAQTEKYGDFVAEGPEELQLELQLPSLLAKLAMTATSQVAAIVWRLPGRFGWLDVLRPRHHPPDVHMNATSGASGSDPPFGGNGNVN